MNKHEFLKVLEKVKEKILTTYDDKKLSNLSETEFEKVFADTLKTTLPDQIEVEYRKGSTIFPDIGCGPFGVEIKTTKADKWVCLGNSIMEGTRREGVEDVFIAFLKKGGTPDIRVGAYDSSISDIKVTHSPRYEVNMDIQTDQTIFTKLNVPYDVFKDDLEKIQRLRQYYKEKGVESWWLDDETGETTTGMELESFGDLEKETKNKYLVEIFALFPEMLNKQYGSAATYLVSRYGVYDKSFRDKISAGGQKDININGQTEKISQSIAHLINLLPKIVDFINENTDLVAQQWGIIDSDLVEYWFNKCEYYLGETKDVAKPTLTLKQIYEKGLTI